MKSKQIIARVISYLFNPLILPTIGLLLLLNSGLYFSMLTFEAKRFLLLVVFFSTFLLPELSIWLLSFSPRFNVLMEKSTDRVIPLLITAVYYYMGYFYLGKIPIFPIYKIFLLSAILVIILLMLVSMKWKVSNHMAGIGGLIGIIMALSFRLGINSSLLLSGLIGVAGLIGTSRLTLGKHNPIQIYVGFFLGFAVNYLVIIYL